MFDILTIDLSRFQPGRHWVWRRKAAMWRSAMLGAVAALLRERAWRGLIVVLAYAADLYARASPPGCCSVCFRAGMALPWPFRPRAWPCCLGLESG